MASRRSLYALDGLNVFLADVRTGVGPFLAIYLSSTLHWDAGRIGVAMSAMSIGSLVAQAPAGALIDRVHRKRMVVIVAALLVAAACVVMPSTNSFLAIVTAQAIAGIAADIFPPVIAALTLGLVGRELLAQRTGRNEAFNHAGNVAAAIAAGLIASYVLDTGVFYLTVVLALGSIACTLLIRPEEIDHRLARGCDGDDARQTEKPLGMLHLFADKRLLWFALAVTLFHFANAAMLPQIGQELAQGKDAAPLYMAACIIVAQVVMIPTALLAGRIAARWGRKPVFLIGFAMLPVRGVLYTLTDNQYALLAIQALDGVGAGIFGVVSVLMIADFTKGSGRFNLTQGAIATAQGIGASLSNLVIGFVVGAHGFNAGFLALATIAVLALVVFYFFVPESAAAQRETTDRQRRAIAET